MGKATTFVSRALRGRTSYMGSVLVALIVAFLLGAVAIDCASTSVRDSWANAGTHPGAALSDTFNVPWQAYWSMFKGSIVNPQAVSAAFHGGSIIAVPGPLSESLVAAAPLILTGLAVAIPFQVGLFNIGAQGQFLGGAIAAGYVGFAIDMPPAIHLIAAVVAGLVGGAVFGFTAGALRAYAGAHEVITTIMLNYVGIYLLSYLLSTHAFERPGSSQPLSPQVVNAARYPHLNGLRLHSGVLIAVVVALLLAWALRRTTAGFALRLVGANQSAARSAGVSVAFVMAGAMTMAGALAGLGGAGEVLGTQYALTAGISGTYGFTAITVALLGRGRPAGTLWAALLFGALQAGGVQMQAATGTPSQLVNIIQALVVLLLAAPSILRFLTAAKNRRQPKLTPTALTGEGAQ